MTDSEQARVIGDQVREYLAALGRKGGAVKGGRKADSARANMAKARETRWSKARDKHVAEQDEQIAQHKAEGDNKEGGA